MTEYIIKFKDAERAMMGEGIKVLAVLNSDGTCTLYRKEKKVKELTQKIVMAGTDFAKVSDGWETKIIELKNKGFAVYKGFEDVPLEWLRTALKNGALVILKTDTLEGFKYGGYRYDQ